MAILAYVDDESSAGNTNHNHRLSVDIAAGMSIALERRVDIPYEIAARIEGHDTVTFMPYLGLTDRIITGPLPGDSLSAIAEVFRQIAGLPDDEIPTVGAAASMYHGALLLHDRDIRSAYTLL